MREEKEQLSQQDMEVHHQWAEHPLHQDLVRFLEEAVGVKLAQGHLPQVEAIDNLDPH
jgi:hypothetical protein